MPLYLRLPPNYVPPELENMVSVLAHSHNLHIKRMCHTQDYRKL